MSLVFFLACSLPSHRESLELIAMLDNGQIFEARFTKGNTGIYKGQGHVRINRWIKRGTPMSYHIDIPAELNEIDEKGVNFFGHRMYQENDIWQLYIRSEEYNVSGQLRPQNVEAISIKQDDWNVDVLYPHAKLLGWSSAMGRSGVLRGEAVLFHRYGTDLLQGERQFILAYDSQNHFGVEYSNLGQQSWGKIHGKEMADDAIELVVLEHSIEIKTNSQSIFFKVEENLGEEDLYDHLTKAERFLASSVLSTPKRYVLQGYILTEKKQQIPAICMYYGESPPTPKRRIK